MINEKELKEALDAVVYVDGNLTVEEKTYNTALRHLPYLAKYLWEVPKIDNIKSNLIFKFGKEKKSSLEILGNDVELTISHGTFGVTQTIMPLGSNLSEEDFTKITNCS